MTVLSKRLPLREAAKISGYSQDYLGFLIRKGKLRGVKVGRDWFVTRSDLDNYLATKQFMPIRRTSEGRKLMFSFLAAGTIIVALMVLATSLFPHFGEATTRDNTTIDRQLSDDTDNSLIDFSLSKNTNL